MSSWRRKTLLSSPSRSGVLISANVRFVDLSCNSVANLCMGLRRHDSLVDLDAPPSHPPTVYDLIANVTHESVAGTTRDKENTVWKVHLRVGGGGGEGEKWLQIQDLIVEETRKEMIFLAETVLQVRVFYLRVGVLLRTCDRFGNAVMPSLVVLTEQREWTSIDGKRGKCAIAHSGGDSGNLLRFIRIGRESVTCHFMCTGL